MKDEYNWAEYTLQGKKILPFCFCNNFVNTSYTEITIGNIYSIKFGTKWHQTKLISHFTVFVKCSICAVHMFITSVR